MSIGIVIDWKDTRGANMESIDAMSQGTTLKEQYSNCYQKFLNILIYTCNISYRLYIYRKKK